MSTFKITSRCQGSTLLLHLYGDLDANTAVKASHQMEALDSKTRAILIYCDGLRYVSSAGLGVFLSLSLHCEQNNIQLALCHIPPHILNVLELIGMDKRINFLQSDQDLQHMLAAG